MTERHCFREYSHSEHQWLPAALGEWITCPGLWPLTQPPHPDTARIQRAITILDRLEDGAAATPGRDFGRGVAHATRQIREALA